MGFRGFVSSRHQRGCLAFRRRQNPLNRWRTGNFHHTPCADKELPHINQLKKPSTLGVKACYFFCFVGIVFLRFSSRYVAATPIVMVTATPTTQTVGNGAT